MANIERGEVELDIDGTTYTLVLDLNAMCEFEAMIGTATNPVSTDVGVQRALSTHMLYFRPLLWAALKRHHKLSMEEVNALVERAGGVFGGGVKVLTRKLVDLMPALRPDPQDEAAVSEANERPIEAVPQGTAGTGPRSTVKRVKSA